MGMKNNDQSCVMIADGDFLNSYWSGSVKVKTKTSDEQINNITPKNVLYVSDIE